MPCATAPGFQGHPLGPAGRSRARKSAFGCGNFLAARDSYATPNHAIDCRINVIAQLERRQRAPPACVCAISKERARAWAGDSDGEGS